MAAKSFILCAKNWSQRTRYTLRSITINFKYKYQPENAIKNFVSFVVVNENERDRERETTIPEKDPDFFHSVANY